MENITGRRGTTRNHQTVWKTIISRTDIKRNKYLELSLSCELLLQYYVLPVLRQGHTRHSFHGTAYRRGKSEIHRRSRVRPYYMPPSAKPTSAWSEYWHESWMSYEGYQTGADTSLNTEDEEGNEWRKGLHYLKTTISDCFRPASAMLVVCQLAKIAAFAYKGRTGDCAFTVRSQDYSR